ncbi:MAG: hypothetical protein ACOC2Y_05760 [Spirochaetota bacterium]
MTTVYHCANAPYDRWPEELPPIWNGILRTVPGRNWGPGRSRRTDYAEQFDRLRQAVAALIEGTYAKEGMPRAAEAREFADVFIAVVSSLSLMRILDPERIEPALFEKAFRALVAGIPEALADRPM